MQEISKAIIEVMKTVKSMEKNSMIGSGDYKYNGTKDADVKLAFNEALTANGLCILPIEVEEEVKITHYVDQYKKQKQTVFTKVKTKYLLLHTSGEKIELAGYGHGVDPQDKGAGKATTYALKNCLLLTFLTPVGKMEDTDNEHSDDIKLPPTEFEIALEEFRTAPSIEVLGALWTKHHQHQNQPLISQAKDKRKIELEK